MSHVVHSARAGRRSARLGASIALTAASLLGLGAVQVQSSAAADSGVVLEVRSSGGLVPVEFNIRNVAQHVVTTGRTHLSQGVTTAIFPGPALRPVMSDTLTRAELAKLDSLARGARLDRTGTDWGLPPTADVPALVVTYRGRTTAIPSYGVGEERLTAAQRSRRAKVRALVDWLDRNGGGRPYRPAAVVVSASPAQPIDPSSQPLPAVADWPTDAPALSAVGACAVVRTPSAVAALGAARETTRFRSGATTWQVAARPLLPGDRGCAGSARQTGPNGTVGSG